MSGTNKKAPELWKEHPITGVNWSRLLQAGRTKLLCEKPLFGRLSMWLRFTPNTNVDTAGVDPKGRFYVNPYFINNCTLDDVKFVIAHEVMHLVQRCHARFPKGGIHSFWNIAADIVVNQALEEAGITPLGS
jgi:predicted metal-dependent peptidase